MKLSPGFVELQLLRHGPPHNQLLSPLTEYLALCGDHPNTTLSIPLEHAAMETRLRALRYFDSEDTRVDQLRETARIASDLFAKVPGVIADLASTRADGRPFVHLSIASRASELAIFPFELAIAPDGFPGAGQPLCLQMQLSVCLTRRSRNVRNDRFNWDRPVKILMIASSAGGEIPVRQHYSLLRKLVEPWVGTMPTDSSEVRRRKREKVLRLLVDASVDRIEKALIDEVNSTGQPFSHIHILAHGCDLPESDRRSGVALHHPFVQSRVDAVDGKRLAAAIGCLPDYPASSSRYSGPSVVTLATCGSADQGGVAVPGASLAFELHDSGIPLVVGSQFPLSADGSMILTEIIYRGILAGRDPRSTVWEARRALKSELSEPPGGTADGKRAAHDWASLTVYAALPRNLDDVLPVHRRTRQRMRMDVRLRNVVRLLEDLDNVHYGASRGLNFSVDEKIALVESIRVAIANADTSMLKFRGWVRQHDNSDIAAQVSNLGILASAQKQVGLLFSRTSSSLKELGPNIFSEVDRDQWAERGERLLREARQMYWRIFELSRDESWALAQHISLDFCLRGELKNDLLDVAWRLARTEEHTERVDRRVWALSVLLEGIFLGWLSVDLGVAEKTDATALEKDAHDLASRIRGLFSRVPREVFSAKRQFDRYVTDFPVLAKSSHQDRRRRHYSVRRKMRMDDSPILSLDSVGRITNVLEVFDDLEMSDGEIEFSQVT